MDRHGGSRECRVVTQAIATRVGKQSTRAGPKLRCQVDPAVCPSLRDPGPRLAVVSSPCGPLLISLRGCSASFPPRRSYISLKQADWSIQRSKRNAQTLDGRVASMFQNIFNIYCTSSPREGASWAQTRRSGRWLCGLRKALRQGLEHPPGAYERRHSP